MANFAAADQAGLVRIVKRKLKKIQYRPHLIDGCLAATGLRSNPGDHVHYEFKLVKLRHSNTATDPTHLETIQFKPRSSACQGAIARTGIGDILQEGCRSRGKAVGTRPAS